MLTCFPKKCSQIRPDYPTIASGKYRDNPGVYDTNHEDSFFELPRRFYIYALENEMAALFLKRDAGSHKMIMTPEFERFV